MYNFCYDVQQKGGKSKQYFSREMQREHFLLDKNILFQRTSN